MEREARGATSWRPGRVVGPAVLSCCLLGACGGSSTPTTPGAPGPTPSGREPAGFLHVLQGDTVFTYAIDGATGRLRESARQTVGDGHTLAGERQGRYVYAAYGPRDARPPYDGPKPSIVVYVPDARTGSLATVSEASSDPIWQSSLPVRGAWYWLSASSTRVYAMWETITYHDVYQTYVTHAVDGEGRLGPAYEWDFDEWDPGAVAVDTGSDLFYKGTWTGGLTAHFVAPDGHLTRAGESRLCVASTVSDALPLVAVEGFVFASSSFDDERTVCSWEGPRLAPRADLGLESGYAVAIVLAGDEGSSAAGRPAALVAMRASSSVRQGGSSKTKYEVRLFAMGADGQLELLDTVEPGYARQLLFHPSGRFLYLSRAEGPGSLSLDDLSVYSIDADGHLALVEEWGDGGGAMAVTHPRTDQ